MPARILLFTGKGGVGKTTTAAATALRCADDGLRTIVLSTDPAHSLADSFDVRLGPLPVEIVPGLFGQQLDSQDRLEDAWADIQTYLLEVLAWAGLDGIEAEELSVLPGLDEVFALADIREHAESGRWDVVIVDCAPTAETLRLLSLPEILSWYMERIFPTARNVSRVVSPMLGRVTSLPMAGDSVFGSLQRFYARLAGVRELLTDPRRTSVRLVVNPERMVIAEAKRTYTYLSLFGYRVDGVIANRLIPDDVVDPWFDGWKATQCEHLKAIDEGFAPVPILLAPLGSAEMVGVERLRAFASVLYGDEDPSGLLHESDPMSVERRGAAMVLKIALPGADRDELELAQHDDELLVRVGPYRRAIALPDSLRRRPVDGAKLVDGFLEVRFGARATKKRAGVA
ncbi:MAG: arsenite/tail-anchored protein-transporting ATPase [Actinomycetota bacterium]|nr:arsenite/tail-anchored protein-transporting ATPase [Actinomycetota bacterium]